MLKTKYRVKQGELHPDEAIEILKRDPLTPAKILKWVDTTGRARYNQAQKRMLAMEAEQYGGMPHVTGDVGDGQAEQD